MASDIWLRTILIVRKETRCRHIGYTYRLTASVLLYAPSHRQDNTYHSLCYTSRGALAGTRNSSICPPHEGSIRRPTAPWANALPLSYVPLCCFGMNDLSRNYPVPSTHFFSWMGQLAFSRTCVHCRKLCGKSIRSWSNGSLDQSITGWTHWAISRSSQCFKTGVTKAVVCAILSVGWCI